MRLVSPIRKPDLTPEGVFASKHAWLMRWAMHFSRNDRDIAEDLVQDVFVRMLLSWDTLHSLHDLEPLLYSYLRYTHLTGLRKTSSYTFQSLSTVDSDTLAISLRVSNSFNQIEVQNELRSILNYLLWRRHSAKFASIFLLRFFHGFYPEEIAAICVSTRHSIDLSLRHARGDVKSFLLDPRSVEGLGRKRMPEFQQPNIAVPAYEFAHELRHEMLNGTRESCPTAADFERNYRCGIDRPLDCGFLAHIVTCEPCLEKVTGISGAPPPSARSMEDCLGVASRNKSPKTTPLSEKATVARAIAGSGRRIRDVFDHHPTGLMIVLNSEVIAIRDVSSKRAVLKVEAHLTETLELIEVFSEQRTLLLTLPVFENPPLHSPQIRHQISLSSDRTLTLHVDFTSNGASVEAVYEDPYFINEELSNEDTGFTSFSLLQSGPTAMHSQPSEEPSAKPKKQGWHGVLLRLNNFIAGTRFGFRSIAYVSACTLAFLGVVVWFNSYRSQEKAHFELALQRAVQAESIPASNLTHLGHAAIHRRLAIQLAGKVINRDFFSDTEGKRLPRPHATDEYGQVLKAKLIEANLDWNDPLTAASFKRWHDGLHSRNTDSQQSLGNLIVMTSSVKDGPIRFESLTVRSSDFHAVSRKVLYEDGKSIEVAEVSYEVVPWDRVNSDWFEPETLGKQVRPATSRIDHRMLAPLQLTDGEIDLAALGVLNALEEMHADTERLKINQSRLGIEVTGVVESITRKQQLQSRLKIIPHVMSEIFTYQEMDAKNRVPVETPEVDAVSVTSKASQLDLHCRAIQIAHDECQRGAYRLLNSTTVLMRDSKRLTELQLQYPADKPLSSDAKTMLASLVAGHLGHLNAALWDQQQTLRTLQLQPVSQTDHEETLSGSLTSAVARNQASVRELVYGSNEGTRPTAAIVRDLTRSLNEARNAISHMPTYAAGNSAASSGTSTPQEY